MSYVSEMTLSKSKAERQAIKRAHGFGNRAERQRNSRRMGPNVRIRQGDTSKGYTVVRLRDGAIIAK